MFIRSFVSNTSTSYDISQRVT